MVEVPNSLHLTKSPRLARFPVRCQTSVHLPSLRRAAGIGTSRLTIRRSGRRSRIRISKSSVRRPLPMRSKHLLTCASSTPLILRHPVPAASAFLSSGPGSSSQPRERLASAPTSQPPGFHRRPCCTSARTVRSPCSQAKGRSRPGLGNGDPASGGRGTSLGSRDAPRDAGKCNDYA